MTSQPDRRERLLAVVERDGLRCVWCRRLCTGAVCPTTDHLVPKVKGGPSWLENEVLACGRCNRHRGHRSPLDWLDECERRGWEPDVAAVSSGSRPAPWCRSTRVSLCGSDHAVVTSGVATFSSVSGLVSRAMVVSPR